MGRPLPLRKLPNHAEPSINLGTLIFGGKVESFVPLLAVDFFPIFVHFFWLAYLSTHCSACFLGVYFMALLNVFNMSSPREPLRMGLPIYQIRAVQTHSIKPLRPALGFFLMFCLFEAYYQLANCVLFRNFAGVQVGRWQAERTVWRSFLCLATVRDCLCVARTSKCGLGNRKLFALFLFFPVAFAAV